MAAWLKDYAGVLSAASSLVLIAVTAVYVRLTHSLASAAERQLAEAAMARLDARMPDITAKASTEYLRGSGSVGVGLSIKNSPRSSAYIMIDVGEGWEEVGSSWTDAFDPTALFLTLQPDEAVELRWRVPVDPNASIAQEPPLTHLQFVALELSVSPLASGVYDLFSWGATYDPKVDAVERESGHLLHERRRYPELPREPERRGIFASRKRLAREHSRR